MPELPEVETIRRDLEPLLVGRRIERVRIHRGAERLAVTHAPRALERALTGRRVEGIGRHGKYLLLHLDDGRSAERWWVVHLRMTGSLVHEPAHASARTPRHRFERARVDLDDGAAISLRDMRKFATWHLVEEARDASPRAGPDALSEAFTAVWLREALARRTVAVKAALLDQAVAAGVGNIYADEACWRARIDPRTPSSELGPRRVVRLHAAVEDALAAAIADRGSSFSDYRDGLGAEGLHTVRVAVFRREGQACRRCGTTIVKRRVAGRGTHLCPGCQRR
ncbi:MAG: bifunctional DNA-formamidopyrimidine glycosylase/DNA-(apurinic or apyrimidinic site) lyase [Chloroflexi bacterium]|nr:bifunctional DNA-formamidopyrimidine glycosylase/DNA-(apurinic or apyrimidinic site) lyase [Chloroflexota bacterium]